MHYICPLRLLCPQPREALWNSTIHLSVPRHSCLGYRHAGCLQLSHRRPPAMCGLWTSLQTDVDPPRFLDSWWGHTVSGAVPYYHCYGLKLPKWWLQFWKEIHCVICYNFRGTLSLPTIVFVVLRCVRGRYSPPPMPGAIFRWQCELWVVGPEAVRWRHQLQSWA